MDKRQSLANEPNTDCLLNQRDVTASLSQFDDPTSKPCNISVQQCSNGHGGEAITIQPIHENGTDGESTIDSDSTRLLSRMDAFVNLCKCFSGACLFAMPWAFSQCGLLSAALSLIFLASLTYFTLFWLAKCSHLHPQINIPTYPELASLAFGNTGFYICWMAIICMTVGVCGSYLVFIGSKLSDLIHLSWLTQTVTTAFIVIPMIALSLFRSYSFLVPFTVFGLFSLFAAAVIVVIESSSNMHLSYASNTNHVHYFAHPDIGYYPLFLGNAAFAFLIHSVILPIEESMRDRQRQVISSDYTQALKWSLLVVTLALLLFAGYAYMAYGEQTCGNIMDNLDERKWYTKVVIIALCFNLFFTYPLFLFPMTESLEMSLLGIRPQDKHQSTQDWRLELKRNALRVVLVLMTAGVAIGIPDFELITGLTGAFGNNVLGLILPPLMYFKLAKLNGIENEINGFHRSIGYFSTLFGVAMLLICTYTFVFSIVSQNEQSC